MNKKIVSGITSAIVLLIVVFSFQSVYAEEVEQATTTATTTPETIPSITIRLRIETASSTLYNQNLTVSACAPTDTASSTLNGYCAIKQINLPSDWSFGPYGGFLNSLGGIANDDTNYIYWMWFSNLQAGQTSLDTHILSDGEELLLEFNVPPLTLSIASSTIAQNGTTSLSILRYNGWNPEWAAAGISKLYVNDVGTDIDASTTDFVFTPSATGTLSLYVTKDGHLKSNVVTLTVIDSATSTATTTNDTGTNQNPSSGGGGGGSDTKTFNIPKAIEFLQLNQNSNGSFSNDLSTDWAALAFSSYSQSTSGKEAIRSYLLSAPFSGGVTDAERRSMALMSLGINPYSGTNINYIRIIANAFDGTQIGDSSEINDDIFSLFPLTKTGFSSQDEIIKKTVAFIISKQKADGSWQNTDLTSATVQALSISDIRNLPDVSSALEKARNYLKGAFATDGFGNAFSIGWGVQAIYALNDSPSTWIYQGKDALSRLAEFQQTDGGMDSITASVSNRVWSTAYTIPAAAGRTWISLLSSFSKQDIVVNPGVISSNASSTATTATTTNTIATTTPVQRVVEYIAPAKKLVLPISVLSSEIVVPIASSTTATTTATSSEITLVSTTTQTAAVAQTGFSGIYIILSSIGGIIILFLIYKIWK